MHVRSYSSCWNLYLELNVWIFEYIQLHTYLWILWTFFFLASSPAQKKVCLWCMSPISRLSAQPRQQWLLVIRNGNGMPRVHVSWAGCWQLVGISSLLILTQAGSQGFHHQPLWEMVGWAPITLDICAGENMGLEDFDLKKSLWGSVAWLVFGLFSTTIASKFFVKDTGCETSGCSFWGGWNDSWRAGL